MLKDCINYIKIIIEYSVGLYHLFQIGVFFNILKERKNTYLVKLITNMVTLLLSCNYVIRQLGDWSIQNKKVWFGENFEY